MKTRYWLPGVVLILIPLVCKGQNPPVATDVTITGTPVNVGVTLTGSYTWGDNGDGDNEGASTYKWYRDDDGAGTNKTAISGATSVNYTLVAADESKYIYFEVTPVDDEAAPQSGTPVESSPVGPVGPNTAPTATTVAHSGDLVNGNLRTGTYTYNDVEGDAEGTSTFKWYRADDDIGTNSTPIPGATDQTYTLVTADIDKYISFEVTPVASSGTSPGLAVKSTYLGPVTNAPPEATSVSISGTFNIGQSLTGSYTYSDEENDTQGTSTFKWYRANSEGGSGSTEISGATSTNYTLVAADAGKFIAFEVTPVATSGESTGNPVKSSYDGPVNSPPTATSVTLSGTYINGETLTGNYTYNDTDGDTEGTSTFKWYRADDNSGTNSMEISGANNSTYDLVTADVEKYIRFEVTPVASTGSSPGAAEPSSWEGAIANAAPFASDVTITGTFANGQTVTGNYNYNDLEGDPEGTSTFQWYRANDEGGAGSTPISGATSDTYLITASDLDKYLSFEVTPVAQSGNSPGTAAASSFQGPVASPELTISHAGLNEGNLDGATVTLTLSNETFIQDGTLAVTLNNFPSSDGVGSTSITGSTTATVTLSFDHTDFDTDIYDFSISILGGELTSGLGIQSNNLTIDAYDETVTISTEGSLAEDNLDGATIDITLSDVTFQDGSLNTNNFTLNNAPILTEIDDIEYTNDHEATITLSYNGTDFDSEITNFSITVADIELNYSQPITSNDLTITHDFESREANLAPINTLTERNLNNSSLTITLTGETFEPTLDEDRYAEHDESGDFDGFLVTGVTRNSDTEAVLTMSYDGDDFDADVKQFYIDIHGNQLDGLDGALDTRTIIIAAYNEILSISASGLSEDQLDEQSVELTLTDDEFIDETPSPDNFILINRPNSPDNDLSVESITWHSTTTATLNLAFNGDDFDSDINDFRIKILGAELISGHDLESENDLFIDAIVEKPTATLTDSTATICDDGVSSATFEVELTGAPPWKIKVFKNGSYFDEITSISTSPYDLEVSDAGIYTIGDVADSEYSYEGIPQSGSDTVVYYPTTTANFDGLTYTVCEGVVVSLDVTLTGSPPWTFEYEVGGTEKDPVTTSLESYTIESADAGQYKIVAVSDANCSGDPSASTKAWIENYDQPTAKILAGAEICSGEIANLDIVLTKDDAASSWEIEIQKDGSYYYYDNTITGDFSIEVTEPGTYEISYVSDDLGCSGVVEGSPAVVIVHGLPSVSIIDLPSNLHYGLEEYDLTPHGLPSGGSWDGGSGGTIVNDNKFYPATSGLGDHILSYTYTESVHGCSKTVSGTIKVISSFGTIDFVDETDSVFCIYDDPVYLKAYNSADTLGTFETFPGLIDSLNNSGILYPRDVFDAKGAGTYTIYYKFPDALSITTVQKTFTIEDPGYAQIMTYIEDAYCGNDFPFDLKGNVYATSNFNGTGVFTGNGIIGNVETGFKFDPGDPSVLYPDQGINTLTYTFTTTNGCIAEDSVKVVVNRIPTIAFDVTDNCLNFIDSTVFVNTSSIGGNDNIKSYVWDFGDNTVGSGETPAHLYKDPGLKTVKLRATTNHECVDEVSKGINFWERPIASFDWDNDCFTEGIAVSFKDRTNTETITLTEWEWNIYDSGQNWLNTESTKDMDYEFLESNFYDVEFIVSTDHCRDTIVQTINLKPTMRLASSSYMEDFESGEGHWFTEQAEGSVNSWEFGTPVASRITEAASGTKAWVTNLSGEYINGEQSWITGPCFDFRNTKRPMIKMNVFADMENQRDGAVIQYSLDNGITWTRVGDADDGKGISWFNTTKIDANPGNEQHGWTGYYFEWREARHDLDELIGQTDVKFRVIFGSGLETNNEGIGIDDFCITERDRYVVLEHFTNLSGTNTMSAEQTINTIANRDTLDVIDLHYHVNFPGADIINAFYPAGPSARTLYYSISEVPYSVMDGEDHFISTLDVHEWNDTVMIKRALVDPKVSIDLDAEFTGANTLTVTAALDTLHGFTYNDVVTLHLVILEEVVTVDNTDYENVVRGMLPDPGGTQIFDLSVLGSYNLTETWTYDQIMIDTSMVVVVAFVQDEDTKEVYQTAIVNFGGVATDIGEFEQGFEQLKFNLYPNPVSGEMYISFSSRLDDRYELEIVNDLGVLVDKRMIPANTNRMTLDVSNYAEGVYTAKITNRKEKVGWKRFIVIH